MLIDLDDAWSRNPAVVGAKAAGLARARAAGLPVLPGVVIPAKHAERALRIGARELAKGGSGAARLAVMALELDARLVAALARQARDFPAIVRSSSELESGGVWAGAFSTFGHVHSADVGTAVRGVWASVFTVDALERLRRDGRSPTDARMAVLVQPQVEPRCGGTAIVTSDGEVDIVITSGPLSQLTAGWDAGAVARVASGDDVVGSEAIDRFGPAPLLAAARLARDTLERVGDNSVEWAFVDAQVILLQSSRSEPEKAHSPVVQTQSPGDHLSRRLALAAVRFPGPLGDRLVLPWLAASDIPLDRSASAPSSNPVAALDTALDLAAGLIARAWAGEDPGPTLRELLGAGDAPQRLADLHPVDERKAARLVALLDAVAATAVDRGWVSTPGHVWRLGVDELRAWFAGEAEPSTLGRVGADRWEPYVYATAAAAGTLVTGIAAAPGVAAGNVVILDAPQDLPPLGSREVIVTALPLPAFAPLLWEAAALVTTGGNPGAHLVEVARSLGVPAVVGVPLDGFRRAYEDNGSGSIVAAVDGHHGWVSFLNGCPDAGGPAGHITS